jgi:hypothetical protein
MLLNLFYECHRCSDHSYTLGSFPVNPSAQQEQHSLDANQCWLGPRVRGSGPHTKRTSGRELEATFVPILFQAMLLPPDQCLKHSWTDTSPFSAFLTKKQSQKRGLRYWRVMDFPPYSIKLFPLQSGGRHHQTYVVRMALLTWSLKFKMIDWIKI